MAAIFDLFSLQGFLRTFDVVFSGFNKTLFKRNYVADCSNLSETIVQDFLFLCALPLKL